jgi:predicted metal-dependent hydrolase
MDAHLRAGVAIYNAGHYHAAHDAWEDHWLGLASGTDDELLLHGLIQFTAAVYHARGRNWSGATGLADSAGDYLADLPADYRGVNVGAVRDSLAALARDPERIERAPPLALTHEGRAVGLDDLEFDALTVVAAVFAEEFGYDEDVLEQAIDYARTDLDAGEEGSRFVRFVIDFAREGDQRGIIFQRLSEHVDRRQHHESDVEGLFDER